MWFPGLRNHWKPKCLITDECATPADAMLSNMSCLKEVIEVGHVVTG